MVKKLIFISILMVFSICLVGCGNNDDVEKLDGISINIKENTLSMDGATIVITDLSNMNNTYGEWFRIDKKEKGNWKNLKPIIDNYAFNLIGYHVDSNNKLELEHDWHWLYGSLSKGKYRIVKEVNNKYIAIEFDIK